MVKDVAVTDAAGERHYKLTGATVSVSQNGNSVNAPVLDKQTLYASALVTITGGNYTKHYFEEGNRICSSIGGGGLNLLPATRFISNFWNRYQKSTFDNVIRTYRDNFGVEPYTDKVSDLYKVVEKYSHKVFTKEYIYYYHTDHLGSATLVTDDAADVVQQIAYLPYGEDWVDIRHHGYFGLAYKFNGKEKDPETGYNYYGARYYSDRLSIWLSVDPMTDKYPSLSGYNYCANNPVMLVDRDGRETKHFYDPKELEPETNELQNTILINAANYFASVENNNAIHIYAHGNSEEMKVYLGEEQGSVVIDDVDEFQTYVLSKFDMWNNRKEGENITIVLHSCSTGQGGKNSFAAKMSKGLENTTILAPDKKLAIGKGYEEVYNMEKFAGYGGLQKNRGRWIQYSNGKREDSHSPKTYWNNISDNINEVGVMDKVLDFCIENFVEKL